MKKLFAPLILFISFSAFAQILPPPGQDQFQQQIQRTQQQLIEEEFRRKELQDVLSRTRPVEAFEEEEEDEIEIDREALARNLCIKLKKINYSGNIVLPNEKIDAIISPNIGKCLTIAQINEVLKEITNLYIKDGYITSRAFMVMPQKQIKQGILEIRLEEGKVAEVEGLSKKEIATAFPGLYGKNLNLRDIEQGLEQINRLASNRAQMDIKPATENYHSNVIINNQKSETSKLSIFGDNAGSKSTGEWRTGLRFAQDNMIGINDQLNLSFTHSPSNSYDLRHANAFTMGFSVPYGYWTFSNNFSYSDYRTSFMMPISGNPFYSYGNSMNNSISIERMMWRGQKHKIALSGGLTYKNANNYMKVYDLVARNSVSSRALSVVNFDLPMTFYIGRGTLYIKPSFVAGLDILGAFDDDAHPGYSQKAQYTAYKLYGYYSHYFGAVTSTISFDGQLSPDELFSSEAFYIGGEYSVRGFKEEGVSGDNGFTLKGDVALNLNQIFSSQSQLLGAFTPSVFIDYGYVSPNSDAQKSASLAGTGAKLSFNYWLIDLSATYSLILEKPDWIKENHAWYLSAGFNIKF